VSIFPGLISTGENPKEVYDQESVLQAIQEDLQFGGLAGI